MIVVEDNFCVNGDSIEVFVYNKFEFLDWLRSDLFRMSDFDDEDEEVSFEKFSIEY